MMRENVISTANDANFDAMLAKEPRLVLAWFSANWCGPCKRMEPLLRVLATELFVKVKVVNIDIEEAPEISERFRIKALPCFLLFHRSQLLARRAAVMTSSQLHEFIEKSYSNP